MKHFKYGDEHENGIPLKLISSSFNLPQKNDYLHFSIVSFLMVGIHRIIKKQINFKQFKNPRN